MCNKYWPLSRITNFNFVFIVFRFGCPLLFRLQIAQYKIDGKSKIKPAIIDRTVYYTEWFITDSRSKNKFM